MFFIECLKHKLRIESKVYSVCKQLNGIAITPSIIAPKDHDSIFHVFVRNESTKQNQRFADICLKKPSFFYVRCKN